MARALKHLFLTPEILISGLSSKKHPMKLGQQGRTTLSPRAETLFVSDIVEIPNFIPILAHFLSGSEAVSSASNGYSRTAVILPWRENSPM